MNMWKRYMVTALLLILGVGWAPVSVHAMATGGMTMEEHTDVCLDTGCSTHDASDCLEHCFGSLATRGSEPLTFASALTGVALPPPAPLSFFYGHTVDRSTPRVEHPPDLWRHLTIQKRE